MIDYLESCGKFGKPFKIVIKSNQPNDNHQKFNYTDRYHNKK